MATEPLSKLNGGGFLIGTPSAARLTCSLCADRLRLSSGYLVAPVRALDSSCAWVSRATAWVRVGLWSSASRTMRSSCGDWKSIHHCSGTSAVASKCCAAPAIPGALAVAEDCGSDV